MPTTADHPRDLGRATMVRAFALGGGVALGLCALVRGVGLAPEGEDAFLFGGGAAAVAVGALVVWFNGLFLRAGRDGAAGPVLVGRLQGLLAAGFAAKLAVLAMAAVGMHLADVKFASTATFCVTFAAASLACQLTAVWALLRTGHPGRAQHPPAPDAAGAPEQNPTKPS